MAYHVPPALPGTADNGRRSGCLCLLGIVITLCGSLFAASRFINARGFHGTVIGSDHTGLLTGGSGGFILGGLFLPAAIRWINTPALWIPVLGGLLILTGACGTIRAAPAWWRPQHHGTGGLHHVGSRLYGVLCGLGAVMTLGVSAAAWDRYADFDHWIGIKHHGLVTGSLSLFIILVSCSTIFIKDERASRRAIGSTAIVLGCLFLPSAIDTFPGIVGKPYPIYAIVGCIVIFLGASSDVVFRR